MSEPELVDLQQRSGVFEDISVVWPINADLSGGNRPERIEALATSPNYFTLLGAQTANRPRLHQRRQRSRIHRRRGPQRWFLAPPVRRGSQHHLAKACASTTTRIIVMGVMPPDFRHPGRTLQTDVDAWIAAGYEADPFPHPPVRAIRMFPGAIARLKPGLTIGEAQAKLETFAVAIEREYPVDYPAPGALDSAPRLGARRSRRQRAHRIARALRRRRLRAANRLRESCEPHSFSFGQPPARNCGAPRAGRGPAPPADQMLTESLLLSFIAGSVALLTVVWMKASLLRLAPDNLPRLSEVNFGGGVLLFAFGLSIATGILFGLVPALQASNISQVSQPARRQPRFRFQPHPGAAFPLAGHFGNRALADPAGRRRPAAAQFLALAGSAAWIQSSRNRHRPNLDAGAQQSRRRIRIVPRISARAFLREAVRRVATIPGVEAVAIGGTNSLPMGGGRNGFPFAIEGRPNDSQYAPVAEFAGVSPNYFELLKTPLISGRVFADSDVPSSQRVAIIDQTLANRYWPGQDPLGQHISFNGPPIPANPAVTIVGVVGDMKSDSFEAPLAPHIYLPVFQGPPYASVLFLKTNSNPGALSDQIRTRSAVGRFESSAVQRPHHG